MAERILSNDQVGQYFQDGYLVVSGLIADQIVARAEKTMWECLGYDRNDPTTWKDPTFVFNHDHPDLVACYTDQLLEAAAQLSGDDIATFRKPTRIYSLNQFPSEGEWHPPNPHIDHSIKRDNYKTFPRPFRIAAMTYLNDVAEHGGGTVVWHGSHHKIRALAESEPQKYEYMWVLGDDIQKVDLGDLIELTPKAGDVLFYEAFTAHSGNKNITDRPRFAYNTKW